MNDILNILDLDEQLLAAYRDYMLTKYYEGDYKTVKELAEKCLVIKSEIKAIKIALSAIENTKDSLKHIDTV
jgi:predicted DNA-binding protein YlxM (UPF0122 family)